MLGGPLAMTLLDTQRSWVGLFLLTVQLAQWQPGLSCAPGEGTHLSPGERSTYMEQNPSRASV